jgi:3-phenylpropionate/trans-cinnamate dioxygenase ferredoxin component
VADAQLIAALDEIPDGEAKIIPAGTTGAGDDIAVFHSEGEYFALDDTCTHEDASLGDGWIEGDQVECPIHAAKFCLRTGAALCLPASKPARTHRVEVRADGIWLRPTLRDEAASA